MKVNGIERKENCVFKEGDEVWVTFKEGSNNYKATIIATGEHFTCVHTWVGITSIEKKEIVDNNRIFPLNYKEVDKDHLADLMLEYAKDAQETDRPYERWEFLAADGTWITFSADIDWNWWKTEIVRRKVKTISINGFEVPEPLKEAPPEGTSCYAVCLSQHSGIACFVWYSSDYDFRCLENNIVHLTKEAAELHAKALLSFFSKRRGLKNETT